METKQFYKFLKNSWDWIDENSYLSNAWIHISWKTIPYNSISSLESSYLSESIWNWTLIFLFILWIWIMALNLALWFFFLIYIIVLFITRTKKVYIIKIINHAWRESYICSLDLSRFSNFKNNIEQNISY